MKVNVMVCIDDDLVEETKKEGRSKLINGLLRDYFNKNKNENIAILNEKLNEESEKKKLSLRKIRDFKQKIAKIKARENRVLRIYNKIPQKILTDLKSFPNMSLMGLRSRFDGVYKKQYSTLSWIELKKVFDEFNNE